MIWTTDQLNAELYIMGSYGLRNKRELWKQVQPNKPFPGVCILQVDQNVPALVVKSET